MEFRESQASFFWATTFLGGGVIKFSEHSKYIVLKMKNPCTLILSSQLISLWKVQVLCRFVRDDIC